MTARVFVVGVVLWAGVCGGTTHPTAAGGKSVGHWVAELKSSDPVHRKEAAEKLGNVGPADPAAFPAVCSALKDPDPKVRAEAVLAVVKFGEAGREAAPTLEALRAGDRSPQVRDYAARALAALQARGGGG